MQAYPSLTDSEFAQACQVLERSCQNRLDGSNWSRVNWIGGELSIRQVRHHLPHIKPCDDEKEEENDPECCEIEELDQETINRHEQEASLSISIDFSIVLSPTYQVPVLWFSFASDIPASIGQLETVYDMIVSPTSRDSLRNIGVLGGISLANHPRNDVPAFFIHPCRTPEVLDRFRPHHGITPVHYLMLWFGIIGSAVGLSVPSEVAASLR